MPGRYVGGGRTGNCRRRLSVAFHVYLPALHLAPQVDRWDMVKCTSGDSRSAAVASSASRFQKRAGAPRNPQQNHEVRRRHAVRSTSYQVRKKPAHPDDAWVCSAMGKSCSQRKLRQNLRRLSWANQEVVHKYSSASHDSYPVNGFSGAPAMCSCMAEVTVGSCVARSARR
jgi:hypothetical protein